MNRRQRKKWLKQAEFKRNFTEMERESANKILKGYGQIVGQLKLEKN